MRWSRIIKFAKIFRHYGTAIKSSLSTGWGINGAIMSLPKTKFTRFAGYWKRIPSRLAQVAVELEHYSPKRIWYVMIVNPIPHIRTTLTLTSFIFARQCHSRKEIPSLSRTLTHFKWVLFVINLITLDKFDFSNSHMCIIKHTYLLWCVFDLFPFLHFKGNAQAKGSFEWKQILLVHMWTLQRSDGVGYSRQHTLVPQMH